MVAEGVRTTHAALALGACTASSCRSPRRSTALLAGRIGAAVAVTELDGPASALPNPTRAGECRLTVRPSDQRVPGLLDRAMGLFDKLTQGLSRRQNVWPSGSTRSSAAPMRPSAQADAIDVDTVEALEELLISARCRRRPPPSGSRWRCQAAPAPGEAVCASWSAEELREVFAAAETPLVPPASRAARGPDRRRQRHGQDDHRREAGQPAAARRRVGRSSAPPTRSARRPSTSCRSGPPAPGSTSCARSKARIRRRWCSTRWQRRKPGPSAPCSIDTAGRLHTRVNLMDELDKIRRIAEREVPGAPHEVLLVLDATVGQNGLVAGPGVHGHGRRHRHRAHQARWHRQGRHRRRHRARSEAADPLCRRRRGDRRPPAVFGRGLRRRAVPGRSW